MDKLVLPIPSNGFPFNNDDIRFFLGITPYSSGVYQALEGILTAYSSNIIVSGCGVSGSNIAEGWVLIAGTLVKVDAHTATGNYFEITTTYNSAGNKQTQTGGVEDSYQQNRATATASSGTLASPVTGSPDTLGKGFTLNLIRNDSDFEATETNKGVAELANQTEGRGGTDATRIVTSLRMLDALRNGASFAASTTNRGTVEKATTAEAQAGTTDRYIDAAALQTVTSTTTRAGIVGKATTAEVLAETADRNITADNITEITASLKTKLINIGTWNMQSSTTVNVAHGLTFSSIRGAMAYVYDDLETSYENLSGTSQLGELGGTVFINSTLIILSRAPGGTFDSSQFDSTLIDRGFIIVQYI